MVPAAYFWLGTYSTDATNILNWSDGARIPPELPDADDDVYISGGWTDPNTGHSRDCSGLVSNDSATSFLSLHISGSYNGTVSLGEALTVGVYEQTAASLSQPQAAYELTITDFLNWTGGTLNSSGVASTVNVQGNGSIAPASAGTVTLGSTMMFTGAQKETTIDPGTIQLINTSIEIIIGASSTLTARTYTDGDIIGITKNLAGAQRITIQTGGLLWCYGRVGAL